MKTDQNRINNLIEYVQGLLNKEDGTLLYQKFRSDIEGVTPQEAFEIFHGLLMRDKEPKEILVVLDKVINVFYKSLKAYEWARPAKDSFVDCLLQENNALIKRLEDIKKIIKDYNLEASRQELLDKVTELKEFDHHYLKKENILFPYLEKKMKKFDGLAIMWALHDETRNQMKKVIACLESRECKQETFNTELANLFFDMYGLVKKEELILFPAASEIINENEWEEMLRQSMEYKFPYIERPAGKVEEEHKGGIISELIENITEGYHFKTETGVLDFEQIMMIFNVLPVDMTFVDENNKVRFFTRPKDRLFPRSPAIIGRDVEKCHPPQSVHVVNEIIDSFRAGKKDNATFWINLKGKKILIQYFALRDAAGAYKGVLEVSQDITEISRLEGERRLLNWDND